MRPALALAVAAAAAITILGCAETEEAPQSDTSPPTTPAVSEAPTPGPATEASPTVTAEPTTEPSSTQHPDSSPTSAPPDDWVTYVDPVMGFSLEYPTGLSVHDFGESVAGGIVQRALQFRPESGMKVPGFSLSMTENRDGLSLEGWLQFTACQSDTVEPTMVDGRQALTCTSQPAQIAEHAAWFEYNGTMLYVTSGSMTRDDFEFLIGSIRL